MALNRWCGPCKLLGPRLEAIISNKGGQVILAKVDVDDNVEIAMEYLASFLSNQIMGQLSLIKFAKNLILVFMEHHININSNN